MQTAGLPAHPSDEPRPGDRSRQAPRGTLRDLLDPLDHLLVSGGDDRIAIHADTGRNAYGCRARPEPHTPSFSSSTASTISDRAFEGAERARDALLTEALRVGLDAALAARLEANRATLLDLLQLADTGTEVVFSASGTDAQLQAHFLARSLLGDRLTSIIVAADQTGSGTVHTARGRHFGDRTASGWPVARGTPVAASDTAAVPIPMRGPDGRALAIDEIDAATLDAVERAIASGDKVLLQVMDSSKLGIRAPSDGCLDTVRRRWPDAVQIVVDACQFRLGRPRLRAHLDAGALVLVTGSKFFAGPAFSGALLVPSGLASAVDRLAAPLPGAAIYAARGDWPARWAQLGTGPDSPANLGQWLRWEAALEEMRGYYAVPEAFRMRAVCELGDAIAGAIARSSCLAPCDAPGGPDGTNPADDEMAHPTIFAVTLSRQGRLLSVDECRTVHRALYASDDATLRFAVGQPVEIGSAEAGSTGVLRLCLGARHVTEAWSTMAPLADRRLAETIDTIRGVVERLDQLAAATEEYPTPRRANVG